MGAPLPGNAATPYPGPELDAVACASTSVCTAAGSYIDSAGNYQGLMLTGLRGTWTAAEAPLPANSIGRYPPYLAGVACPSTSACIAVGTYSDTADNSQGLLITGSRHTGQGPGNHAHPKCRGGAG